MHDYDVIVIGGGPAGSTAATLVAQAGRRVLLLDREQFPRFRIGESLMPATYWTLKRMGVLEKLRASEFPQKYSVQFFSSNGKSAQPFYFSEVDDHESSQTWQVDRTEFDHMLLEHAAEAGVEVRQQVNVKDVRFAGTQAIGVTAERADGMREELDARVIVDASGQNSLLARRFNLREIDPQLRHAAFYTRYNGARRGSGKDEGATLIFWTADEKSWFWFIPLPGNVASVGVVGPLDHLITGRSSDPQQVYDEELAACPALRERLEGAPQLQQARVLRDFSYISKRIAGDGWVMVGDAFGFLDPVYSTGVFLAIKGAEFAADSIIAAFERQEFGAAQLGVHGPQFLAGMESMRRLVYAYYDRQFSFARFLKQNPECREPLVNLLVGNVYRRPVNGLFDALGQMCSLPEPRSLEEAG